MKYYPVLSIKTFAAYPKAFCLLWCFLPSSFASGVEKIEVRGSQTSIATKVFTHDNVIVSPNEISSLQRSVGDIVSQVAGVERNGQGGLKQSYNIRGFSRSRIKTEIDGIPIITDRRAGSSSSFLPAAFISSIYLQKGPSATLYGSGAMGGVISISTIDNSLDKLGASYQFADQTQQVYGVYNQDNLTLGLLYRRAENSEAADHTELNTQFKQTVANIHYHTTWRDVEFNLSSLISDGNDLGKSTATFAVTRDSIYPEDQHWLSRIKVSNNSTWQLQLHHHQQAWQSQVNRLSNAQSISEIARQNIVDYQSHSFGAMATVFINHFTLGAEWLNRANIEISEQEFDAIGQAVWQQQVTNADTETYSAFIERAWQLNKLNINFGVRYDEVHAQQNLATIYQHVTDSYTSTSLRANYQLTEQHYLSAEIASAFRFPSISELFFSGETPRGNTQGNSDLSPEKSLGWQLNYRYQFNQKLSLTANSYLYDIDDHIERYQLNADTRSYRNTDRVKIKGFELSALWQASPQLQSTLSYQWQQGKDKEKQTIDDGLPTAFKWQLSYQPSSPLLSDFKVTNQVNYRFAKADFGPSEQPLDAALIWHSSISWALLPDMDVKLTFTNITDQNYRASSDEDAPFQPQRSVDLAWQWFY